MWRETVLRGEILMIIRGCRWLKGLYMCDRHEPGTPGTWFFFTLNVNKVRNTKDRGRADLVQARSRFKKRAKIPPPPGILFQFSLEIVRMAKSEKLSQGNFPLPPQFYAYVNYYSGKAYHQIFKIWFTFLTVPSSFFCDIE